MQVSIYLVVGAPLGLIVAGGPLGALMGCITSLLFMIVNQLNTIIKRLYSSARKQ